MDLLGIGVLVVGVGGFAWLIIWLMDRAGRNESSLHGGGAGSRSSGID